MNIKVLMIYFRILKLMENLKVRLLIKLNIGLNIGFHRIMNKEQGIMNIT
jgi:hypothetical protein